MSMQRVAGSEQYSGQPICSTKEMKVTFDPQKVYDFELAEDTGYDGC